MAPSMVPNKLSPQDDTDIVAINNVLSLTCLDTLQSFSDLPRHAADISPNLKHRIDLNPHKTQLLAPTGSQEESYSTVTLLKFVLHHDSVNSEFTETKLHKQSDSIPNLIVLRPSL